MFTNLNYIFIQFVLLLNLSVVGQTRAFSSNELTSDLIGIWTVTDFDSPDRFEDTWELLSDGTFNELKYTADGSTEMMPDENGSWSLDNDTLTITVTNEDGQDYDKPTIWKFVAKSINEGIKLEVLFDSNVPSSDISIILLTEKR